MFKRISGFVFIGLILASALVHAKKGDDEEAVPTAVGGDLASIQTAVENHGTTLATLQNQVNEMVAQFQEMNGEIGRNYKKVRDQDKIIKDLQTRLQTSEDKNAILTLQLQELKSIGLLPAKATLNLKEFNDYSKGLEMVNAKQFDKAVAEFQKFQEAYSKSAYVNFAQYWIGEAYYMQADYPMAIKQYQKLLSNDPKSDKAASALYRQGMSFYQLQSFEDAKAFFSKVIRTYPQSIEAQQASSQIARINNIQDLKKQQELEMKLAE